MKSTTLPQLIPFTNLTLRRHAYSHEMLYMLCTLYGSLSYSFAIDLRFGYTLVHSAREHANFLTVGPSDVEYSYTFEPDHGIYTENGKRTSVTQSMPFMLWL